VAQCSEGNTEDNVKVVKAAEAISASGMHLFPSKYIGNVFVACWAGSAGCKAERSFCTRAICCVKFRFLNVFVFVIIIFQERKSQFHIGKKKSIAQC
jgi:hypothetical protein